MLCKGSEVPKGYKPTHRPDHGTPSSSSPPCSSTKSKPTNLQSSSNRQPNPVECGSARSPPLQPTAQVSLQPSFPAASKPAFNRVRLSFWPFLYNLPVIFLPGSGQALPSQSFTPSPCLTPACLLQRPMAEPAQPCSQPAALPKPCLRRWNQAPASTSSSTVIVLSPRGGPFLS